MTDQPQVSLCDVILPVPLPGLFTYLIPSDMVEAVVPGVRVVVQFGKHKIYTAVVRRLHQNVPHDYEVKYVLSVLDAMPYLSEDHFRFWEWMAGYYLCTPGDVMQAALPSALKLASESKLVLHPLYDGRLDGFTDKEQQVIEALHATPVMTLSEAALSVGVARVIPLIRRLIEQEVVVLEEELQEKYRPKTEVYVTLSGEYHAEDALRALFDSIEKKAPRQVDVLSSFLTLSGWFGMNRHEVRRADVLRMTNQAQSALDSLVKKKVLNLYEKDISRFADFLAQASPETIELSQAQQLALQSVLTNVPERPVLLHGMTSSGKTEIYIKMIHDVISRGGQVLFLLPEIALTTQIVDRLRHFFGSATGVYHSRYNDQERGEVWFRAGRHAVNSYSLILGARSAIFLPFHNLKLIIVDEEHDASFKQYDPAPRYQARDTAVMLAHFHQAGIVLGSATPSVESYFNALAGKYALVKLTERYGNALLPKIELVNLKGEAREKTMKASLSSVLFKAVESALGRREQVILFQNRRGFAPHIECDHCSHVPQCRNCDVTLTYHKAINLLRCHYCGYSIPVPAECPVCSTPRMLMKGLGTERIEDDLKTLFPDARIGRMDLDTTRSKHAFHAILTDFGEHRIDILVGTQMVTKGLDFDRVSVVGVLNADTMLSFPDFRAFERGFQMLTQVSGRAGRKDIPGRVIIQTRNPHHQVLEYVLLNDYFAMYSSQVNERRQYLYPPFVRLVVVNLKHTDPMVVKEASEKLAGWLKASLGDRVLGPVFPLVARVKNLYIRQIVLKLERSVDLRPMKEQLITFIRQLQKEPGMSRLQVTPDVDPS